METLHFFFFLSIKDQLYLVLLNNEISTRKSISFFLIKKVVLDKKIKCKKSITNTEQNALTFSIPLCDINPRKKEKNSVKVLLRNR
jgi:hypothetical protein